MSDSGSDWVVSTTDASFAEDVIERSKTLPIVVDFWAEWCQPCRMLTPLLEKLAEESQGAFLLVKANTEENPSAANEFGVQSIPAVFGLRDGKVVDAFMGVLPEDQIREWLKRVLPSEVEELLARAQSLINEDVESAETLLVRAMELDPRDERARIEMLQLLLQENRLEECTTLLEELEARGFLEPEAERVKAALNLQRQGGQATNLEACRDAVANHPDDPAALLRLAEVLAASHDYQEALQTALQVVQLATDDLRDSGRQLMLDVFRLLPDDSELTREYRRKLSMALF